MVKGTRKNDPGPSDGIPAPRDCLLQRIERITPQNSFNRTEPVERGIDLNRRGFLGWGTLLVTLFSFLGLARILQSFLSLGRAEARPTRYVVGRFPDFPPGEVVQREGVFVVRDPRGLYALKGDCPHLGCAFRWDEAAGFFECPCHGSRFERTGRFLSGPAKKPLQRVLLTKSPKNEIIADVSKPVPEDFRLSEG